MITEGKDMEGNDFDKTLEELKKPSAALPEHQRRLRLTYVSAKKSARWGIPLIVFSTTILFISFGVRFPPGSRLGPFFHAISNTEILGIPLTVLLFLGGLLAALVLNLLSVIHISLERNASEIGLMVVVKKKYWNIAIVLAIFAIVGFIVINLVRFQRSG